MNSVVLTKKGEYGWEHIPIPKPGQNQVLIKVDSAALNPSDILFMRGLYKMEPKNYPFTPGWEGSGTVIETGPGLAANWFAGKKVAFMKQFEKAAYVIGGAFAEYAVTDVKNCIPLADDMDLE